MNESDGVEQGNNSPRDNTPDPKPNSAKGFAKGFTKGAVGGAVSGAAKGAGAAKGVKGAKGAGAAKGVKGAEAAGSAKGAEAGSPSGAAKRPGKEAAKGTGTGQDPKKTPAKAADTTGPGSHRSGSNPISREVTKATKTTRTESTSEKVGGLVGSVTQGAVQGASTGAAAGGVGAVPGAIVGAAKGFAKNKTGRKVIRNTVLVSVAFSLIIVAALGAMITSMVGGDSTSRNVTMNEWGKVHQSMAGNGYSGHTISVLQDATSTTAVPFPVLAAAAWVHGETLDLDATSMRTPVEAHVEGSHALTGRINNNVGADKTIVRMLKPVGPRDAEPEVVEVNLDEPIGPFQFDYHDAVEKFGKKHWTVADLIHPASAAELYASWLNKITRKAGLGPLDLGVGVSSSPVEYDAATGRPIYGFSVSDKTGVKAADDQRKVWTKAIAQMPVVNGASHADKVYSAALQWYLGNTAACNAGTDSTNVVGDWTPPLHNSTLPSSAQDFGPRNIGQGFHDGLDMNTADGSLATIYAAASGTVTFASFNAIYGPNWVKITHPGGYETHYGHMSAKTVAVGDEVAAGQEIGTEGNEGFSFGAHLHFSVKENGEFVDPVAFYAQRGVDIFAPPGTAAPPPVTDESPPAPPPGSGVEGNQVRIVQANIPMRKTKAEFADAMETVHASGPDFVSLNEMMGRRKAQFTPAGYDTWRAPQGNEHRQALGNVVGWRTDRWTKVASGRITMMKGGPISHDNRYAGWVTVKSTGTLGNVSFVSVHHMVNPNHNGPNKPLRKRLYREGMVKVQELVRHLEASGPVFLAGDFNHRAPETDPWGPKAMLGAIGYQASFTEANQILKTTVGGGSVDYIFAPRGKATLVRQWTKRIPSDHLMLGADYTISDEAVQTERTLPTEWTGTNEDGASVTLDSTQLGFAAEIASVAEQVGAGREGAIIAFMTVLVEGGFRNYASDVYPETIGREYPAGSVGSDHDSVGLFQQRPQSGWGDPLELLEPNYAARAFFGGPSGPNGSSPKGLLGVSGWETLPKGVAAQTVQVSAHPDRYGKWETAATELHSIVAGASFSSGSACPGEVDAHYGDVPSDYNLGPVQPQTAALANLLGPMFGITTIGGYRASATDVGGHPAGLALDFMVPLTPEGKAQGDALAEYAKSNAASLQIDYIIWQQRIWSTGRASEGWRPMADRGSPTANHMDHPHINLKP